MMVEEKERLIRLDKIINSEECFDKLYTLVKDVELLLNRQFSSKSSTWFRSNYNNKLIELDLANINGQVRQKELISSFNYYYSKDLLCILQSNVKVDNENNWLSQIVRKHRKTFHPLRHLLLIQFLDISLDELFNEKIEVKPFGEGPWPCLNAGAEHYLKDMIHDVDITYDSKSKKPIGTFKCKCGFIYSRSGPDIDNMDRYKVGRVKKFGSVWEEKLRSLVEKKLSLRQIARGLKVDPMTINKYAENLQLEIYWRKNNNNVSSYNVKDTENADDKRIRDEYRKLWLQLIKNNPDKNKTELRKLDSKVYAWLYRNDKKWFDKHTINAPKRCKIGNRIDWKKRDEEILYEVKYTVEVLLSAETKPERITISKVGKKIGKLSLLQNHLDKLPLTDKYIENHMESVEEFQKRRIKWAINELEKEGEEVKGWKVIRKAGIKELYDKHIDYYLKQLID